MSLIVTIDGPAGAGKSTVALRVAQALGLRYLNSGAIYRAVTLAAIESDVDFDDGEAVATLVADLDLDMRAEADGFRCTLGGRDVTTRIKDPDITSQVYRVADVPAYRTLLVERQRRFAVGGVVAEGRDMGTVIFPDAPVKIFLDAPAEARAARQHLELTARGVDVSFEEVRQKLLERDAKDRGREVGGLVPAPDAVPVDTGGLSVDEVVGAIVGLVRERSRETGLASSGP